MNKQEFAKQLKANPTPAEQHFKTYLKQHYPRIQVKEQFICGPFILDFYFPTINLALELDGSSHDGKENYDGNRDNYLLERDISILHAKNHVSLTHPEQIMDTIREYLQKQRIEANENSRLYHEDYEKAYQKALLLQRKTLDANIILEKLIKLAKPFNQEVKV